MGDRPNYYAIIPANVRYDKDLIPNAKLLYGEITALCNEKGYCWATNEYFASLYNVSHKTITSWINSLVEKTFITTEIVYKEGSKEILHRYLRIVPDPTEEKVTTPTHEKVIENTTVSNTTSNNTKEVVSKEIFKHGTCVVIGLDAWKSLLTDLKKKGVPDYGVAMMLDKIDEYDKGRPEKKRYKDYALAIRNWVVEWWFTRGKLLPIPKEYEYIKIYRRFLDA